LDKKIKLEKGININETAIDIKMKETEKKVKTEEEKQKFEADAPNEEGNPDLITYLEIFLQFMRWDHADVEHFLEEMHNKIIKSHEDENKALIESLQSYVDTETAQ